MNVGTLDRAVRISVGFALFALAAGRVIGPWGYIGILPLLSGMFGSCPAYSVFGLSTCSKDERSTRNAPGDTASCTDSKPR